MLQASLVQETSLQEVTVPASPSHTHRAATSHCPNCNAAKTDRFCSSCGSEGIDHHDLSLKHFLHHSLHEFTHIEDSKVLATLKSILFKPGHLTKEHFAGRKVRYLSPVRLYLIAFALSLFVYTVIEKNVLYSVEMMVKVDQQGIFEKKIQTILTQTSLSRAELYQMIDKNWMKSVHFLEAGFVVVITLLLTALYRKRYVVEHVTFTLHLISFMMLYAVIRWPLYHFYGAAEAASSTWITAALCSVSLVYTSFALKHFYEKKWRTAIFHALIITVVYFFFNSLFQVVTLNMAIDSVQL